MSVHVVGIGGSIRTDSQSERALRIALAGAEEAGAKTTMFTGSQIMLPFYDPSVPERPPDAIRLIEELRERMRDPRPGDLVLEISRLGGMMPGRFDPDSIGRLLRVEGDRWVVEPLHAPGAEQGWQNADFIALPGRHRWLAA